jgi:hypothetical protein
MIVYITLVGKLHGNLGLKGNGTHGNKAWLWKLAGIGLGACLVAEFDVGDFEI